MELFADRYLYEPPKTWFDGRKQLLWPVYIWKVRSGKVTGLSPLLPSATGQAATPLALEREIEEQISHLQEIDRRPRFSIHYETDVSPLSRAKEGLHNPSFRRS